MLHQFWIPFIILSISVLLCERKWCMLRDQTRLKPQPYSWSRVQLAWWTVIILSSFIAIIWKTEGHEIPKLHESVVILLGISGATIAAAQVIDLPDQNNLRQPAFKSDGFFLDILSDNTGVSISRFQNVVFNLIFGVWFIGKVLVNLSTANISADAVMPVIEYTNLALLGVSSVTYAAIKSTDKKAAALASKEPAPQLADDGRVG